MKKGKFNNSILSILVLSIFAVASGGTHLIFHHCYTQEHCHCYHHENCNHPLECEQPDYAAKNTETTDNMLHLDNNCCREWSIHYTLDDYLPNHQSISTLIEIIFIPHIFGSAKISYNSCIENYFRDFPPESPPLLDISMFEILRL